MTTRDRNYDTKQFILKIGVIFLTGVTSAVGLNYFLVPANVFSAGMNGVAQIISGLLLEYLHVTIDTGAFILLLNIPIFIMGYLMLGKKATIYSFVNVLGVSLMTMIIPTGEVTDNILMNALVGGVLVGVGVGCSLKLGFTTGGLDIVSLILSKTTGKTVGNYILLLNGIIIVVAGVLFNWESALYTIISIYSMIQVIDAIHTSHQKVTALIITMKTDEVATAIANNMVRGMTLLPSVGGYSRAPGNMIMMVVTRYELYDLEQILREADENAFVNIVPTHTVLGHFANEDEQQFYRMNGAFPEAKPKKLKKL